MRSRCFLLKWGNYSRYESSTYEGTGYKCYQMVQTHRPTKRQILYQQKHQSDKTTKAQLDINSHSTHLVFMLVMLLTLRQEGISHYIFCFPLSFSFTLFLIEFSHLPLIRLDFSCNKITEIPISYRKLKQLQHIVLDNNPMQSPPAQVFQQYSSVTVSLFTCVALKLKTCLIVVPVCW